jgi:hypothetical protein
MKLCLGECMSAESLIKRFEEAVKKEPPIHFRSLLVAAINAIPAVGGTLASLFDDYIPSSRQERILSFIRDISIEIEHLKYQLDMDKIQTDSFAYIFEKSLMSIGLDYQKDKMEAYKSIILNSLMPNTESAEIREYFFNIVDSLTPIHIRILKAIKCPQESRYFQTVKSDSTITIEEDRIFLFQLEPYPEELIGSAWKDLHSKGLVKETKSTIESSGGERTAVKGELTEFGRNFINFITMPT